jgi:hypothetical protein
MSSINLIEKYNQGQGKELFFLMRQVNPDGPGDLVQIFDDEENALYYFHVFNIMVNKRRFEYYIEKLSPFGESSIIARSQFVRKSTTGIFEEGKEKVSMASFVSQIKSTHQKTQGT